MKKHNSVLLTFFSLFLFANVLAIQVPSQEEAINYAKNSVYSSASGARVIAFVFYNDKKLASRYIRYNQFYAKKQPDGMNDFLIDHVAYPLVDTVIGNAMGSVHVRTDRLYKRDKEFASDELRLILSGGSIRALRIFSEDGADGFNTANAQKFGKACVAQVGCDAAAEYVVRPTVKSIVGDNDSFAAWILESVANACVASAIINAVDGK